MLCSCGQNLEQYVKAEDGAIYLRKDWPFVGPTVFAASHDEAERWFQQENGCFLIDSPIHNVINSQAAYIWHGRCQPRIDAEGHFGTAYYRGEFSL